MTETNQKWQDSPARRLTGANYLPEIEKPPSQSIHASESERQEAVIDIVQFSGKELGRNSPERRMYLEAAGIKYGQVLFLSKAEELRLLFENTEALGIDIDDQGESVKQAIITDIEDLNRITQEIHGKVDPERLESIIARTRLGAQSILADDTMPTER